MVGMDFFFAQRNCQTKFSTIPDYFWRGKKESIWSIFLCENWHKVKEEVHDFSLLVDQNL